MSKTLDELFDMQGETQRCMLQAGLYGGIISNEMAEDFSVGLPVDSPKLSSYHVQQLMSEIGEVLDADKRWKNIRNEKYDRGAKVEELADCFIVLMNICMYSGITAEEFENVILNKMHTVRERVTAEESEKEQCTENCCTAGCCNIWE